VDPTGAVVPGVNVSLASVAGRVVDGTFMPIEILQVRTNNAGAFAFPRVATGDWTFRTGVAGFTNIVRAVQMRSGQAVVQNVSLTVANLATTLNVTANRPGQSQNAIRRGPPLRIGGEIIQPRLISQVQPAYPEAARDSGVQDFVQLQAVIGKDGTIVSVQVDPRRSSPGNPDLDKAAMAAVQQWRYSPAVLNGVPIEVTTTIRVNFTLD
jgi:TonB family protein